MDRRRLSAFASFLGYSNHLECDNQLNSEQRRLSDGPCPQSLRRPFPYQYHRHPGDFGGSEACMLKRKNSSLNVILDSTSSIMRTASSTFQCLIGSARRASYCGQLDPSVQLAPNGNCGSLYLRSTVANSNESSLSIASYDEQRRRVTIYDGRVPCTPTAPTIPFELMTPFDAITQAADDPVESFVQIVLETPDERPLMMPLISPSPTRMDLSPRQRHRSCSPGIKPIHPRPVSPVAHITLPKLNQHRPTLTTEVFDASLVHCQLPDVIEPMDFSFLEPVLRGESAAPPPPPHVPSRNQSLHLVHQKFSPQRQFSHRSSSTTEDSAIELRTPSRSSYSSNRVATIEDDLTSPESLSGDTHNYYAPSPIRSNLSRAMN